MNKQTTKMMIKDLEEVNITVKKVGDILIGHVQLHNGSLLVTCADHIADVITNLKMGICNENK